MHFWGLFSTTRHRASLGRRGERHAARYLRRQGMRIIARNRRYRGGEIDLIAIDERWLVFVEVRTRATGDVVTPEGSIRRRKKAAVAAVARRLARKYPIAGLEPRIDVVAIIWPTGERVPTSVRHHRFAFPLSSR